MKKTVDNNLAALTLSEANTISGGAKDAENKQTAIAFVCRCEKFGENFSSVITDEYTQMAAAGDFNDHANIATSCKTHCCTTLDNNVFSIFRVRNVFKERAIPMVHSEHGRELSHEEGFCH